MIYYVFRMVSLKRFFWIEFSSLHLWSDWDKSFGMTGTFYWSESFTLPVIEVTLTTKAIELRRYFFPIWMKLVIMIKKIVLTQNKSRFITEDKIVQKQHTCIKRSRYKRTRYKVALMFQQHRKLGAMNDRFAWN